MSGSDVSIVAFGRPERDDAQSHVLLAAATLGATTRLVTSSEGEDFSSMDHGSIDWRGALDGAHWFVTSASRICCTRFVCEDSYLTSAP